LAGAAFALWPGSRAAAQRAAEESRPGGDDVIACLSVRSGLDLMLGQLALPAGSEVLVSAVTIEDMMRVVRHHGLVPLPIDVDPADLSPRLDAIDAAVTPRTKALLVAHLFGTLIPMQPFADKAREHGLLLWEGLCSGVRRPLRRARRGRCVDVQLRADQNRNGAGRRPAAGARP
jgi:dTDP-4-amino-4,6-dideoxygalactose transaminase